MSLKSSSRVAAPFILASLGFLNLHCASDDGTGGGTAGAAGTPAAGMSSGGGGGTPAAGSSSGGSSAGMATAGSGTGGAGGSGGGSSGGSGGSSGGSGGSSGGSGGSSGGSGGSSGGSGGSSGGSGGAGGGSGGSSGGSGGAGGGGADTFTPVKMLLAQTCAGNGCHSAASNQLDLVTSEGLHGRLTSAIPNDVPHCPGDKPVVAADQMSLLLRVVKGSAMCTKAGGGMETIAKMPDHCGEQGRPPCLTEQQIKVIADWIAAGAPM